MSYSSDGIPGLSRHSHGHYNPNQPRVPRGHPNGGQWTTGGQRPLSDLIEPSVPDGHADPGHVLRRQSAQLSLRSDSWSTLSSLAEYPREADQSPFLVQLAAMSWPQRVKAFFAQLDLFGRRLPPFREGGPTAGILQTPSRRFEILSGKGGPASNMAGKPGYDRLTLDHAEGHAAAIMRKENIPKARLYINNPRICDNCANNLKSMLPPGAELEVVLPNGKMILFKGQMP